MNVYYRPPTKLGEGNVFTGVCHSVHGGGVRVSLVTGTFLIPGGWGYGIGGGGSILEVESGVSGGIGYLGESWGRVSGGTKAGGKHPTGMLSC